MKKQILIMLLVLAALPACAQRVMKYQVRRGEDLAAIAAKFGMTERELKKLNEGLTYCYAGMTIEVRDHRGRGARKGHRGGDDRVGFGVVALKPARGYMGDPDVAEAHRLKQMGDFRQAARSYSRAIDRNPTNELVFSRGVCYFEMKKWKRAIADFERVSRSRNCPPKLRRTCDDYLDEAYLRLDDSRERKANVAAGIVAGVVAAGVVADAISSGGNPPKGGKGGKPKADGGKANKPGGQQKPSAGQQKAPSGRQKAAPQTGKSGSKAKPQGGDQHKRSDGQRGGSGNRERGSGRR